LGDFGTGRFVASSTKKFNVSSLLEVSTIYYCAPEGLLNPNSYGNTVDIWALGCIVYEMLTKAALLSIHTIDIIKNFEMSLLKKMIVICGKSQPEDLECVPDSPLKTFVLNHPELESPPALEQYLKTVNDDQVSSFMKGLLSFNPRKRLSAESAFKEPFISQTVPSHLLPKSKQCSFQEPLESSSESGEWTVHLLKEIKYFLEKQ